MVVERCGRSLWIGDVVQVGPLWVYPIHGRDVDGPHFVPLPEALRHGVAVARETGRVGHVELEVDGVRPVFGLAGDLVRGGRQDRVIRRNVVATSDREGRLAVPTYCVEAARWSQRGQEDVDHFGAAHRSAPASLRALLARGTTQEDVWEHVRETQTRLSHRTGTEVRSPTSRTSLSLSLDHPDVRSRVAETVAELSAGLGQPDVVGHVVVDPGAHWIAEWFGSADLYRQIGPRLLDSAATSSLAGCPCTMAGPSPAKLAEWLGDALDVPSNRATSAGTAWSLTRHSERAVAIETVWGEGVPVHTMVVSR